jgi:photosystem II PsbM protein
MKCSPKVRRDSDTFTTIPDPAMETNDLGFVASLLFVLVPAVFLIVLFIQTNSRQSG